MREYELAVLLHPDLEIDQDKAIQKVEKQVIDLKGKVVKRDDWGKRKLAYPVAKQQYGLYFFYHLELDPSAVSELERSLQIAGEVMRYLVVKYEPHQPNKEEAQKEGEKSKTSGKSSRTTTKAKEEK